MGLRHVLIAILIFYIWVSGPDTFNFNLDHGGSGDYISYNHLTEALLAGKLHLLREPPKELLELPDPYEPNANLKYRWQDASLYKGKYYMYFGITPAVILYLPFKFLTNATMRDTFATVIFLFGSVLWSALLLAHIKNTYFHKLPDWVLLTSILVLGFGNLGSYLVKNHCGLYHVAIACGCFFFTGAIYWLIIGAVGPKYSIWKLALGSLFLGLGVGARPQIIVLGIILYLIWMKVVKEKGASVKNAAWEGFALSIPFLICLVLLSIYNYLRFESITEFGFTYQTGDINIMSVKPLDIDNIIPNIYLLLLNPPGINSTFPFFHPSVPHFMGVYKAYYIPPMVGLFATTPFLITPIIGLVLNKLDHYSASKINFPKFEVLIMTSAAILFLLPLFLYSGCTLRSITEVAMALVPISIVFWFYLNLKLGLKLQKALNIFAICSCAITIFFSFCLAFYSMRPYNRYSYNLLETITKPLSDYLFKNYPDWDSFKIRVTNVLPVKVINPLNDERVLALTDDKLDSTWDISADKIPTISFKPDRPSKIKSIWLLSKHTTLYECWKNLEVKLYLSGELVSSQKFSFPYAHKRRLQYAKLNPTEADEMSLTFFDPVTINHIGKKIDLKDLSPGYTEIVFEKSE